MPSRDFGKLHPVVRRKLNRLIALGRVNGLEFIVTQTMRTHLEQQAYWMQGREPLALVNGARSMAALSPISKEENERRITWVRTSTHEYGLAFDIALKGRGGKGVHWDTKADINAKGGPDYDEIGKLGEECGLIWGGRFKSRDLVHFEWTGGLTLKELKAGQRPPEVVEATEDKQEDTEKKTDESVLIQAFEDEYPTEQEDKMIPALIPIFMTVVKGLIGRDNHKTYEKGTGKKRPIILSRRSINMAVVAFSVAVAGWLGFDVPSTAITGVLDAGGAIVDTFEQNKLLLLTAWSSVMTLIGYFKRRK